MIGKPKTLEEAIDVCGELNLGWKSSFDVMVDLAEGSDLWEKRKA